MAYNQPDLYKLIGEVCLKWGVDKHRCSNQEWADLKRDYCDVLVDLEKSQFLRLCCDRRYKVRMEELNRKFSLKKT